MTLEDWAQQYGTDKLSHGYLGFYERHLGTLRHQEIQLLEIGVQTGASLRMWESYFVNGTITGVDIDPKCLDLNLPANIVIADVKTYTPDREFDVIVDDGSHHAVDVTTAIGRLWNSLKPGGWYVIEDWQVQFDPGFGGGPEGSQATQLAQRTLFRILSGGQSAAIELHAYPKILFLRKAP